jgi:hypothetical protein
VQPERLRSPNSNRRSRGNETHFKSRPLDFQSETPHVVSYVTKIPQHRRRGIMVEPQPKPNSNLCAGSAGVPPAVFGVPPDTLRRATIFRKFHSARRETVQPGRLRSPSSIAYRHRRGIVVEPQPKPNSRSLQTATVGAAYSAPTELVIFLISTIYASPNGL